MHQVHDYRESPKGDVLIHLAEEPDRGKVNKLGSGYLNEAADVVKSLCDNSYHRVLYASSGVVYGDKHDQPCQTSMPVAASDVYSQSKLMNEEIVLNSGGVAVRLSNLYGQGMSDNNVMSDIIRQVPGTGPLKVRDDKPIRDYLHVEDAASAFGLLIEKGYSGIVNAGTGIGTSVRSIAELALNVCGQSDREIIATTPSANKSINVLDISATKEILDWLPALLLKEQLAKLIENKGQEAHD